MATDVLSPAPPREKRKKQTTEQTRTVRLRPYHVVLLDDDDHTYAYVIEMLMQLFGHAPNKAFRMACQVDLTGRVVVETTGKERADLKRDQILAYGPDWRLAHSRGSMAALVEPAG